MSIRLFLISIFYSILILYSNCAYTQTKKALLIGIEHYFPEDYINPNYHNLDGPAKDVALMKTVLLSKYFFSDTNIKILLNDEASKSNILTSLKKLAIETKPGDIIIFYYSGHGSTQKNSAIKNEPKIDEGFVPADFITIHQLVRDKEINPILNIIVDNGGVLTCIYDCCHSGGLTRGFPQLSNVQYKYIPPVEDIDSHDPTQSTDITERGALVLTACRRDQNAACFDSTSIFTQALSNILINSSVNDPIDMLFTRVNAISQTLFPEQHPLMAGVGRLNKTIFGIDPSTLPGQMLLPVIKNTSGTLTLMGGKAIGIESGCILKKYGYNSPKISEEIEVTEVTNLNYSKAELVRGSYENIVSGDLFYISEWSVTSKPNLNVYIPFISQSLNDIIKTSENIVSVIQNKVHFVSDPAKENPDFTIYYNDGWFLSSLSKKSNLGYEIDYETLEKSLVSGSKIFISLPAPMDYFQDIKKKYENEFNAVQLMETPNNADYYLCGRYKNKNIEYSWVKPGGCYDKNQSTIPLETAWISTSNKGLIDSILSYSVRLGKDKAWLELKNENDMENFPYTLALKRHRDNAIIFEGPVFYIDTLSFELVTTREKLLNWKPNNPRYIYVIGMNNKGEIKVLYPNPDFPNFEKVRFPVDPEDPPLEIKLDFSDIYIGPPPGYDTYILITSDSQIPDFQMVEQPGVQEALQNTGLKGDFNSLSTVLKNYGARTRGDNCLVTTNWSVEKLVIESKEQ